MVRLSIQTTQRSFSNINQPACCIWGLTAPRIKWQPCLICGATLPPNLGIRLNECRIVGQCHSFQILHGQRAVTGDTAIRLSHWFEMSAEFWMNLQTQYDLALARGKIGDDLEALPRRSA